MKNNVLMYLFLSDLHTWSGDSILKLGSSLGLNKGLRFLGLSESGEDAYRVL